MTKQFHPEVSAHLSSRERVGIEIHTDGKCIAQPFSSSFMKATSISARLTRIMLPGTRICEPMQCRPAHWSFAYSCSCRGSRRYETLVRVSDHYARKYGYMLPAATRTMIQDDVMPTTLRIEPAEVEFEQWQYLMKATAHWTILHIAALVQLGALKAAP